MPKPVFYHCRRYCFMKCYNKSQNNNNMPLLLPPRCCRCHHIMLRYVSARHDARHCYYCRHEPLLRCCHAIAYVATLRADAAATITITLHAIVIFVAAYIADTAVACCWPRAAIMRCCASYDCCCRDALIATPLISPLYAAPLSMLMMPMFFALCCFDTLRAADYFR